MTQNCCGNFTKINYFTSYSRGVKIKLVILRQYNLTGVLFSNFLRIVVACYILLLPCQVKFLMAFKGMLVYQLAKLEIGPAQSQKYYSFYLFHCELKPISFLRKLLNPASKYTHVWFLTKFTMDFTTCNIPRRLWCRSDNEITKY